MSFRLESTAFDRDAPIPARHTCQGADVSPPLAWRDPPPGAKGFALICEDPDAPGGTWVHWVIYGIPMECRGLDEAIPRSPTLRDGSRQGTNDLRRMGWGGPCPPPGKAHRYYFRLYALGPMPALGSGLTATPLRQAMDGHVLGTAEWMGTYRRA